METTRTTGSCCGHGANAAPAHRTAAPAQQGYTPVDQLHNEIDRLFGDFFGGFFSPRSVFSGMAPRTLGDTASDMLIPQMDLSVTDDRRGRKEKRIRGQGRQEGLLPYGTLLRLVPPRPIPARGCRNRQDHRDPQGRRAEHRDSPQGTGETRRPQD